MKPKRLSCTNRLIVPFVEAMSSPGQLSADISALCNDTGSRTQPPLYNVGRPGDPCSSKRWSSGSFLLSWVEEGDRSHVRRRLHLEGPYRTREGTGADCE